MAVHGGHGDDDHGDDAHGGHGDDDHGDDDRGDDDHGDDDRGDDDRGDDDHGDGDHDDGHDGGHAGAGLSLNAYHPSSTFFSTSMQSSLGYIGSLTKSPWISHFYTLSFLFPPHLRVHLPHYSAHHNRPHHGAHLPHHRDDRPHHRTLHLLLPLRHNLCPLPTLVFP